MLAVSPGRFGAERVMLRIGRKTHPWLKRAGALAASCAWLGLDRHPRETTISALGNGTQICAAWEGNPLPPPPQTGQGK